MIELPDRRPRVLVSGVVLGQPMGGVRRHNAELLPRAAQLLADGGGGLGLLEGRVPLAFDLPPSIERFPSRVRSDAGLLRAIEEARALHRVLATARDAGRPFGLVHTAHFPTPWNLRFPFTLTIHDLRRLSRELASPVRRLAATPIIDAGVRAARCTMAVSETIRTEIHERFEPQRTALVSNAADHLPLLPRTAGDGAPILYVGHLERRKNVGLLLHALAGDPALPSLDLVGRAKAKEEERLRALARDLGLADRVRFRGPVTDDELARLYAACGCVALPSHLEGFGIPVLEAQRAGAPVAIARLASLREVAGEEAPTFPPEDAAACAGAIRAALSQDESLLERARVRTDEFTWDASARALVRAWCEADPGH